MRGPHTTGLKRPAAPDWPAGRTTRRKAPILADIQTVNPHLHPLVIVAVVATAAGLRLAAAQVAPVPPSPVPLVRPETVAPLPVPRRLPERPRPTAAVAAAPPAEPSACRMRLTSDIAIAPSLDPIDGDGECDVADPVRLEAVVLEGGSQVALSPPAVLRCRMAEAVAAWLREDVAPALAPRGAFASIVVYDALSCRPRNRVPGAKISEHGKGNAIDIRALALADGTAIRPTDLDVERPLRARLRGSACARFTTVLGPGSDGYHEAHIHLDLAERRNGYRLCHWELDPPPAVIPLPSPRPLAAATDVARPAKDGPK